jgi:uncharacterized protein (TIGR03067 family)
LPKEASVSAATALIFAVVPLVAADDPAQDLKKERDKLEGEWTIVSVEGKGKKLPDDYIKGWKLTIKGDQWTFMSRKTEYKSTFKIDPAKDPKTIDLTGKSFDLTKGADVESLSPGIYKLEGDTLTVCRTSFDPERPKEFKTTEETGARRIEVWKRAKK